MAEVSTPADALRLIAATALEDDYPDQGRDNIHLMNVKLKVVTISDNKRHTIKNKFKGCRNCEKQTEKTMDYELVPAPEEADNE